MLAGFVQRSFNMALFAMDEGDGDLPFWLRGAWPALIGGSWIAFTFLLRKREIRFQETYAQQSSFAQTQDPILRGDVAGPLSSALRQPNAPIDSAEALQLYYYIARKFSHYEFLFTSKPYPIKLDLSLPGRPIGREREWLLVMDQLLSHPIYQTYWILDRATFLSTFRHKVDSIFVTSTGSLSRSMLFDNNPLQDHEDAAVQFVEILSERGCSLQAAWKLMFDNIYPSSRDGHLAHE